MGAMLILPFQVAVNIFVLVSTLFIPVPIIVNILVQTTMSVVVLVYSVFIFTEGWPQSWQCQQWRGPNEGYWPEDPECRKAQVILQILMGIGAGLGLIVGYDFQFQGFHGLF